MPRHIDAWMDGVLLSTIGPILIQQVHEDAPELELQNAETPGRYGQRLTGRRRNSLKVALEVAIRERFDLAMRSAILEELARWCQGSVLELSNHPGRRLAVACTAEPTLGTVRDYTSAIRLEFTAYEVPYWEDNVPSSLSLTGTSGTGKLVVPGTAATPVEVTAKPTGGALTSCTVTVAGQQIALTGLSVAKNGTLSIARDAADRLAIRSGSASLLSKRSAASADDLFTTPGVCDVSFTTNTASTITFSARGRWL